MKYFRHGDVNLIEVKDIPGDVKTEAGTEIMRGEVTGHAHRLMFRHGEPGGLGVTAVIMKAPDGTRYLKVDAPTDLAHEEHHTRTIPPGNYEIRPTRETDHMAGVVRQVAD